MSTTIHKFRDRARSHFRTAATFLDTLADENLVYSALHLRLALECLTYEILASLKDDVSDEIMSKWQPSKLIKELKELDDSIDGNRSIEIGMGPDPVTGTEEFRSMGTDRRLSAKWVSKNWNALGSFLHESSVGDLKNGRDRDAASIRKRLIDISKQIGQVLESPLFSLDIKVTVGFECTCGFKIVRRVGHLKHNSEIECPNCINTWLGEEVDGQWRFGIYEHRFKCHTCESLTAFPARHLKDGIEVVCETCGDNWQIVETWGIRKKA